MLYQIGKKFYIKVQGYYKEVEVKVNGDNLDVAPIPNGDEIEVYGFEKVVKPIDMMTNKDELKKELNASNSMPKLGNRTKEENSKYNSRI